MFAFTRAQDASSMKREGHLSRLQRVLMSEADCVMSYKHTVQTTPQYGGRGGDASGRQ
jgi:hypothetical protein